MIDDKSHSQGKPSATVEGASKQLFICFLVEKGNGKLVFRTDLTKETYVVVTIINSVTAKDTSPSF